MYMSRDMFLFRSLSSLLKGGLRNLSERAIFFFFRFSF